MTTSTVERPQALAPTQAFSRSRAWIRRALSSTEAQPQDAAPAAACQNIGEGVAIAFQPLIGQAVRAWRQRAGSLAGQGIALEQVGPRWTRCLVLRLADLSLRTLVLELQVARLTGQLEDADPSARFHEFFVQLGTPTRLGAFFDEYEVLGDLVVGAIESWLDYGIEVLSHFVEDRAALLRTFGIDAGKDPLVALHSDRSGDRHCGGRMVLKVAFASGRRLVYKPRSSTLDAHFQRLLQWIAGCDARFEFRTLGMLAGRDHGWIEFVEHAPCASMQEASLFFGRQGEYLALLHALDGCDIHFENLIAAGAFPVLVDLEGLFHPSLFGEGANAAEAAALRALRDSVLKVGLLPWRIGGAHADAGADVGGLTAPSQQLSPRPVLTSEAGGSDAMHLVRKRMCFGSEGHRARLAEGDELNLLDHLEDFEAGFDRMYRFLADHRHALLAPGGPLSWFVGDTTRFILRSTTSYALTLQESLHPDLLRRPGDRLALIQRIKETPGDKAGPLAMATGPAAESERADLIDADIPTFSCSFGSTTLKDSRGRIVTDRLPDTGLSRAHKRLLQLGDEDRALQGWIIRASLVGIEQRGAGVEPPATAVMVRVPAPSLEALQERALALARGIGKRLEQSAYRGFGEATWLGINAEALNQSSAGPLQGDLYGGLPGVVLFLAQLAQATGDAGPRKLAEEAATIWLRGLRDERNGEARIGAFVGYGGAIYTLAHLARLWGRDDLLDEAEAVQRRLPDLIEADRELDIVAGSAGCLASLLVLYAERPGEVSRSLAIACGDHLLKRAVPQRTGWGWPGTGGMALGGFSHGAAGIGWAIFRLARATGLQRFADAGAHALAYDRSLLDADAVNWQDLRRPQALADDRRAALTCCNWCHGAPGIGLARLDLTSLCDEAGLHAELDIALRTTSRGGFSGSSHCLCHGAMGNLELLLETQRRHGAGTARQRETRRILARVLDEISADGGRCGVPLGVSTPGLMTGLAGIGHGLLRVADPRSVPSILLLEPPRRRTAPHG